MKLLSGHQFNWYACILSAALPATSVQAALRTSTKAPLQQSDYRHFEIDTGVMVSFADSHFYVATESGEYLPVRVDISKSAGKKVTLLVPAGLRGNVTLIFHIISPGGEKTDGELGLNLQ